VIYAQNLQKSQELEAPDTLKIRYRRLFKSLQKRGSWLGQSEEHATLDLGVVISSPMLGVEITKNIDNKSLKRSHLALSSIYAAFPFLYL